MSDVQHRRFNPLNGSWVLVSPGRLARPWDGQRESADPVSLPRYEPACYLCPGNVRAGNAVNPRYTSTYVFANDFPALTEAPGAAIAGEDPLFVRAGVSGSSRVICYSPEHDMSLARLPESQIAAVVDCWAEQVGELGRRFAWVQVFENSGEIMGCSNPHPHGQIWALDVVPSEAEREDACLGEYRQRHGSNLLLDYARAEVETAQRVVEREDPWVAVVPWWAAWPFETLLVPLTPVAHLDELDARQRLSLARLLKRLLARYDNLFECRFPYSLGWHGRPFGGAPAEHWQLHAHFYPPLLRSATIRKFMVGFELLAEPQRDLTPEAAAERLRGQSPVHFRDR